MKVNLTEKEKFVIKNLQDQENLCIAKYTHNAKNAKDPVLKDLFSHLKKCEETHYKSLQKVLDGSVPSVKSEDTAGKDYKPTATYTGNYSKENKENDCFLCTDSITTEKYVSGAYDFDLYQFGDSNVRKLLNDIQTEEQNHAEMMYKYKVANDMIG